MGLDCSVQTNLRVVLPDELHDLHHLVAVCEALDLFGFLQVSVQFNGGAVAHELKRSVGLWVSFYSLLRAAAAS